MISSVMTRRFRRRLNQGRKALLLGLLAASLLSVPSLAQVRTPQASGTTVFSNGSAVIDASNASQGYVMVKYSGGTSRIKVRISKGTRVHLRSEYRRKLRGISSDRGKRNLHDQGIPAGSGHLLRPGDEPDCHGKYRVQPVPLPVPEPSSATLTQTPLLWPRRLN